MAKKIRGIGTKTKREYLGIREELWQDGRVHTVSAWVGHDRKYWIRFRPNFGFRWGKRQWSRAHGKRERND